jgi:hypothetical protein
MVIKVKKNQESDITKNLVLFLIAVMISLLLTEILLRILFPQFNVYIKMDNQTLYRLKENSIVSCSLKLGDGGKTVFSKINSHGLRDYEYTYDKDSKKRVIILGDSFIQEKCTDLENTFAKKLEIKLNKTKPEYEVINLGVEGYGPDQTFELLKNEGIKYKPDIVILAIFSGNDFGDLIRNKLYRLNANREIYYNEPTLSPLLKIKYLLGDKLRTLFLVRSAQLGLESFFNKNSTYVNKDKIDEIRHEDKVVRFLFGGSFPYDIDLYIEPKLEITKYKIELMDKLIGLIKNYCEKNNIKLILLFIPSRQDVDSNKLNEFINKYNLQNYNFNETRPTIILEDLAKKNNVKYISLLWSFRSNNENNDFFRIVDEHWNEKGQEFASNITYNELIKIIK